MMHIPGGKFSHFHACAILYREQQPNCKPGLDRRYQNLGKSVSPNHWQYVSIYNLQRKPETIVSQANKSKDHQFNVEGRIVEVFLDVKEDRGASCRVWTLGLTSFWQPTAHPTCNIQPQKLGQEHSPFVETVMHEIHHRPLPCVLWLKIAPHSRNGHFQLEMSEQRGSVPMKNKWRDVGVAIMSLLMLHVIHFCCSSC